MDSITTIHNVTITIKERVIVIPNIDIDSMICLELLSSKVLKIKIFKIKILPMILLIDLWYK